MGDSMTGRGIHAGDIAVAEADAVANVGDVVVALIDRESTLKSLAKGATGFFLKSENPDYPDLFPATQMRIQGVVRTLIRKVS
jgi:repressor LexA